MGAIASPTCAKKHKWSEHGRVIEVWVTNKAGVRRRVSRRICVTCSKAYQAQYKRPAKQK